MRLDFSGERVLAVVAHPDDADYLCAGTLARAQADGAQIGICVLCKGDRGQSTKPVKDLAALRRREMKAAAKILGATLLLGEFSDGQLVDSPVQRKKLIQIYRRFQPTLILAHWKEDYHSDHRAAGALAEAASWYCASLGHKTQTAAMDRQPALWWMDTVNMIGFEPGFLIDVSDHIDLKRRLLTCHKSQILRGKESDFTPLAEQMIRQSEVRGAQAGVTAAEAFRVYLAWKRARAW